MKTRSARPSDGDDLGPALELLQLVWAVEHAFESRSKRLESALGVTVSQRMALHLLARWPGSTAGSLAKVLKLHPSTLTGILQRLEDRGLVRREQDDTDRRRSRFSLTRAGVALDRDKTASLEPAVRRLLRKIPGARLRLAGQALNALTDELVRPL